MTATARSTDPWTSWAAARSIDTSPSKQAVLWLFDHGDMTLEEMTNLAYWKIGNRFTPQRLRTAAADLMRADLLTDTGRTKRGRSGRRARVIGRVTDRLF